GLPPAAGRPSESDHTPFQRLLRHLHPRDFPGRAAFVDIQASLQPPPILPLRRIPRNLGVLNPDAELLQQIMAWGKMQERDQFKLTVAEIFRRKAGQTNGAHHGLSFQDPIGDPSAGRS
ncbi:hypothetical protein E2320_014132, partial [Naja naja]